eukprot:8480-Heterococcus_DN1.PRE.2
MNGVAQAQRGLGLSAAALATPACCRMRRSQGASLTLPLALRSQHVSQELVLFFPMHMREQALAAAKQAFRSNAQLRSRRHLDALQMHFLMVDGALIAELIMCAALTVVTGHYCCCTAHACGATLACSCTAAAPTASPTVPPLAASITAQRTVWSPNERVILQGAHSGGAAGTVQYSWQPLGGTTELLAHHFQSKLTSQNLIIKSGVLEPGGTYDFELTVRDSADTPATAATTVRVQVAPSGGSISAYIVTAGTAAAGLQSYTLVATGWRDSADSSTSLTYAWSYIVTQSSSSAAATATPLTSAAAAEHSTVAVSLPPGKVTLQCSICDSSSVCTAAEATITVLALSSAQTADLPAAVRAAAAAATAAAAAASSSTAAAPVDTAAAAATLQSMVGYAAALTTAAHRSSNNSSEQHSSYAALVAA